MAGLFDSSQTLALYYLYLLCHSHSQRTRQRALVGLQGLCTWIRRPDAHVGGAAIGR
jgi:hypothetical protein